MSPFTRSDDPDLLGHRRGVIPGVFVVLGFLAALLAALTWSHLALRREKLAEAAEELAGVAEVTANRLAWWVRERLGDGAAYRAGRLPEVLRAKPDEAGARTRAWVEEWLGTLVRGHDYAAAAVVDRDRKVIYAFPPRRAASLAAALQAAPVSHPGEAASFLLLRGFGETDRTLALHVPLDGGPAAAGGSGRLCLVCVIDSRRYLGPLLREWPGRIRTGRKVLLGRGGEGFRVLLGPGDSPFLAPALLAGGERDLEGCDTRGVEVLASVRPVPGTDWVLVAERDREEALAALGGPFRRTVFLGLGLVGLAWLGIRSLQARARLREAAARRLIGERYRAIVESARDGILISDAGAKLALANRAAVRMLGYEEESEILGRDETDLFAPEARELIREYAGARRRGEDAPGVYEVPALRRDGTTFPAELAVSQLPAGDEVHSLAVLRDVTVHREALEHLAFEAKRHEALLAVARAAAEARDLESVSRAVLDGLLAVTGAEIGFVGHWNEARTEFHVPSFTEEVFEKCRVEGGSAVFRPPIRGLWGWILEHGEPLLTNAPRRDPRSGGLPEGHLPIHCFLGLPAVHEGKVQGLVAVANAPEGFGDRDLKAAEHFALLYAENLHRWWAARAAETLREEKELLEHQLARAQRLESVGRLAGGIAHDFNNLLTVIGGYAELAARKLEPGSGTASRIARIRDAADRARNLVAQILAFSRRQVLKPRVLDLNEVLGELSDMLRRLIGEDVRLVVAPGPDLARVRADPAQVEQVIANLAVNARDAMPGGGTLTLETANVVLDAAYAARHAGARPGPHVMLAITDTGTGVPPEVVDRIFDPFFTTKEAGKGTGLGLSTVYGIVKQSGGSIYVYSEPGKGTTFKVYLPAVQAEAEPREREAAGAAPARGTGTILVVEDEDAVRAFIREVLTGAGYRVLEAGNGARALETARAHEGTIDLLLTDVVMPEMGGRELHAALREERGEIGVIYMSGYTENAVHHNNILEPGLRFLEKPFTAEELLAAVGGAGRAGPA